MIEYSETKYSRYIYLLTFLRIYFLLYKNTLLFLLSFFMLMKDPIQMIFYFFTFRSEANGNYLFSAFSIAMWGDNRHVNDLRILTAIELYVNPEFDSQHPVFTLLLNNNCVFFNSIDKFWLYQFPIMLLILII